MAFLFYTLAILTSAFTAWLYSLGVGNSLFWIYWWYDILIHILAGLMLGFWAAGGAAERDAPSARMVLYVVFVVLSVALLWEGFEIITDIADKAGGAYYVDTFADICNAILGSAPAMVLYILLRRTRTHYV